MRAAYCCPSSAMILSLSIVLFAMRMLRSSQHGVQVAAQDMSRTTVAPTKPCKCKKGKDGMNPSVEPCGSSKTECEQDSAYRWCALTSTCDPPGDDSCDKAVCERFSDSKGSYQYCAVTQTCDPPGDNSCDKAECEQDSFSTVSYQWCALTRTCNALDDPCEETPPTPAPSLIPSSIAQEEIVLGVVDIDQPQPELSSSDASMSVAAGTAEVEAAGADAVTRTQPPTSAPTLSSTTYLHPTFSPTTTYIPTSYGTTFGPTTTYLPTSYATTFGPTTFSAAVVIVRPVITKIDSRESSYDDCDGGALLCSPFKTAALIIGILLLILVLLLCCCYQYYYKMQQQQQQQERDAADAEQPKNDELELDTSDDSSNGQNPDDGSTNTATLQFGRRLVDYVVTIKSSRSGRKSQVKTASHRCTSPNCLICAKKRKAMLSIPEQYDLQQTQKEQREELERQKILRMGKCAIVPDYDEESTINNDGFVSAVYDSDTDTEYDRIDTDIYDRNSDTNHSSSTEADNGVSADNMNSC